MGGKPKTAEHGIVKRFDGEILIVFLLALAMRIAYFLTVRSDLYYRVPLLDSAWYHRAALQIAHGDFWGTGVFFRAPLYSYFVAFWYRIVAENPAAPKIAQLFLGAGTCAVLVLVGRRMFDRRAAFISGIVAACYPILIFFDGELLATSVASFLGVLLLFLVLRAWDGKGARPWVIAGLVLGLAGVNRPTILIFGLALVVWLMLDRSRPRRAWAGLILGAAVFILPVTVRNALVARDPVPIAYQGGVNFYMGNNPEADGKSARLPGWSELGRDWSAFERDTRRMAEAEAGRTLTASEESRFWTVKALRFLADHPSRAAALLGRKIYYLANGFEIANNKDVYFFGRYSPILGALVWKRGLAFPTGLLIPLAAIGLVFSTGRPKKPWVLYLYLLCQAIAILAFFVCARFRVAVLPVLILFAVWGVRELAARIRGGPTARTLGAGLAGIALLILSNTNLLGVTDTSRWQDHYDLGLVHARTGDFGGARSAFEQALRLNPDDAPILYNLGNIHLNLGNLETAARYFGDALRIDPGMHSARVNLGICLGRAGRLEDAEREFQRVLEADPGNPQALANLRLIERIREEGP